MIETVFSILLLILGSMVLGYLFYHKEVFVKEISGALKGDNKKLDSDELYTLVFVILFIVMVFIQSFKSVNFSSELYYTVAGLIVGFSGIKAYKNVQFDKNNKQYAKDNVEEGLPQD